MFQIIHAEKLKHISDYNVVKPPQDNMGHKKQWGNRKHTWTASLSCRRARGSVTENIVVIWNCTNYSYLTPLEVNHDLTVFIFHIINLNHFNCFTIFSGVKFRLKTNTTKTNTINVWLYFLIPGLHNMQNIILPFLMPPLFIK